MLILKFSQKEVRWLEYIFFSVILCFIYLITNFLYYFINVPVLCACADYEKNSSFIFQTLNSVLYYSIIIFPLLAFWFFVVWIFLYFTWTNDEVYKEIYIKKEIDNLFNINFGISKFWFLFLCFIIILSPILLIILALILNLFLMQNLENIFSPMFFGLSLVNLLVFIYSSIKRFKDLDMKWYNILFLFVPIINLYFLYLLFFKESKKQA